MLVLMVLLVLLVLPPPPLRVDDDVDVDDTANESGGGGGAERRGKKTLWIGRARELGAELRRLAAKVGATTTTTTTTTARDANASARDARDGVDVSASPKPPVDPRAISSEDRAGLLAALEDFLSACARAVEVHATATRSASAGKRRDGDGASTIEQMQGMFVRCAAEVRRDVATAVARAEEWHAAGDGEGSEKSA